MFVIMFKLETTCIKLQSVAESGIRP